MAQNNVNKTAAEKEARGICFGVSVGPGASEQVTLEALYVIRNADVIYLPTAPKEECAAYRILKTMLPEIDQKEIRFAEETGDAGNAVSGKEDAKKPRVTAAGMKERHQAMARETEELLDRELTVAYPTLGETALYSTYLYIHEQLEADGYESRFVSGVSSVQAVCARLGVRLGTGKESVHIFPGSEDLEEKLRTPGTLVFMKPRKDFAGMIRTIREFVAAHEGAEACGVSNCGMPGEILAKNADELEKLDGYLTVIMVRSPGEAATAGAAEATADEASCACAPEDPHTAASDYFENRACQYYPCHNSDHINCLFCYCPMYFLDKCAGQPEWKKLKDGRVIKVCTDCTFPHQRENYEKVMAVLKHNMNRGR